VARLRDLGGVGARLLAAAVALGLAGDHAPLLRDADPGLTQLLVVGELARVLVLLAAAWLPAAVQSPGRHHSLSRRRAACSSAWPWRMFSIVSGAFWTPSSGSCSSRASQSWKSIPRRCSSRTTERRSACASSQSGPVTGLTTTGSPSRSRPPSS